MEKKVFKKLLVTENQITIVQIVQNDDDIHLITKSTEPDLNTKDHALYYTKIKIEDFIAMDEFPMEGYLKLPNAIRSVSTMFFESDKFVLLISPASESSNQVQVSLINTANQKVSTAVLDDVSEKDRIAYDDYKLLIQGGESFQFIDFGLDLILDKLNKKLRSEKNEIFINGLRQQSEGIEKKTVAIEFDTRSSARLEKKKSEELFGHNRQPNLRQLKEIAKPLNRDTLVQELKRLREEKKELKKFKTEAKKKKGY